MIAVTRVADALLPSTRFQLRNASHASFGMFPQAARAGSDDAGAPLLRVSPFATAADKKPDVRTAVSPVYQFHPLHSLASRVCCPFAMWWTPMWAVLTRYETSQSAARSLHGVQQWS
jgi:hypothetical protein